MSLVYFNIWQIRQARPDDFEKGLIRFARDTEETLPKATSPFAFSKVNECMILKLFRLVGCDDSRIGNHRKLLDDRSDAAHANGNIFFNTQHEADAQIRQVIQAVEEIQIYSCPVISRPYQEFLPQSHNPQER